MPSARTLPPEIEQALARGATILTANQRAARTLRRAYDLHQRGLGRDLWEPPAILAWDTWTHSLWNRLLLDGHASAFLLSPAQEHTIWRNLIAADTATASLRPVDALAETAADAWKRLNDYAGRSRLTSFPGNSDTRAFARWVAEFERRCSRDGYLTEAQLAETLRDAISAGCIAATEFLLVGFDSKTPAQTAVLDAIRANSTVVTELDLPPLAPSRTLVDAPDDYAELAACARWLRTRLTENPSASIAVIVPQIEPTRAQIDRVFRNILAPELEDIAAPAGSGPFEFSLGIPLARTPIAAAALDILRWSLGPLPLDRVCALLLSPHFAAVDNPAEHIARAEFDAFTLRDQSLLQPEISVDALYRLAAASRQSGRLQAMQNHLRALRTLLNNRDHLRGERSYAEWTAVIHQQFEAAGWAPASLLDSVEFQARRKWDSTLDELATLDFDGARIPFKDAVTALERISAETLFAPESRHTPVQIMGPLESAGSAFDAAWFLCANDLAWPANPSPNPLLPWHLQRELSMPGVDPARDTAHASRITARIAASAPAIVFSYAKQSADSPQRPSPILAGLSLEPRSAAGFAPAAHRADPIVLALANEDPIPPPPDRVLEGGAAILQSQAACGFRAFAEKRLFASTPDNAALGLDARERGSLVHSVLERFWAVVETQAALKRMSSADRASLLARSIDDALARHYAHPEPGWPVAYLAAERQRLLNLLGPWLDYEADERPPFTVLSREESLTDVPIGPLRIAIRVDRVDQVYAVGSTDPAGELILDYKTGTAKPADWQGPRPDAPQLPLYAVVAKKPDLAAIAFANVRLGKDIDMTGYEAAQSGILPHAVRLRAPSLEAQVDEWRTTLTSLAEEFHAGNAAVSPKHYPQTCQYCEQRLLCRLNPLSLAPDILEEIDEDEPSEENDFV